MGYLTVGELREFLKNYDDDTPVLIPLYEGPLWQRVEEVTELRAEETINDDGLIWWTERDARNPRTAIGLNAW